MSSSPDLFERALALHRAGDFSQAEALYRRILDVDPQDARVWHLWGVLAHQQQQHAVGRERILRSIVINPHNPVYFSNLSEVCRSLGLLDESLACARRAISMQPDFIEGLINQGTVLHDMGHMDQAIASFNAVLRVDPGNGRACSLLGASLEKLGRFVDARHWYRRGVELRPDLASTHEQYGNSLREEGRYFEAAECYRQSLSLAPNPGLRIRSAILLPVIPQSIEEIREQRNRLEQQLSQLLAEEITVPEPTTQAGTTPFYLAYHGFDNRRVLSMLAELYRRTTPSLSFVAPHCLPGANRPASSVPIRVGFLSKFFFFEHPIDKHYSGLIRNMTRGPFHVTVFRFPGPDDHVTRTMQQGVDEVITLAPQLDMARRQIAEQQLDILFYTDIGMDPLTYFLAFARLAPVQCVTWGHPETTGLPTIDYFLSNDDLEPPNSEQFYTEKLVRLKHDNIFYYPPEQSQPRMSRSDFGLAEDAHLYLCAQTLFKLHPEFDDLLAAILRADPAGRVLLFNYAEPHWTELLQARFARSLPDVLDRIDFLPRQPIDKFRHLLCLADVVLDTIHFSGGTTSLEAFAVGAPIVTWPGHWLRGRQTYAYYKKLGVLDCIAADFADYVRIAVRLGTEPEWRESIHQRILAARHVLFENVLAVRELEAFFATAVEHARSEQSE